MHGKHSWCVEDSSSEDVVIEQTLRDEVVEYIKRKSGVCFSFWYKLRASFQAVGRTKKKVDAYALYSD